MQFAQQILKFGNVNAKLPRRIAVQLPHLLYADRSPDRRLRRLQQMIRRVAHRAQDDDRPLVPVRLNNLRHVPYALRIRDRAAAKFHHNHIAGIILLCRDKCNKRGYRSPQHPHEPEQPAQAGRPDFFAARRLRSRNATAATSHAASTAHAMIFPTISTPFPHHAERHE